MADIISKSQQIRAEDTGGRDIGIAPDSGETYLRLVELLFFAYRDFTGEPDTELAGLGLGRAHHRVLHFVARHPGLRVADILDVLKITKQSLARVLKQLVDEGWIEQRPGPEDRRERLLSLTPKGRGLAARLAQLQTARIAKALEGLTPAAAADVERFLFAIIAPSERDHVARMLAAATSGAHAADAGHNPACAVDPPRSPTETGHD